MKFAVVYYSFDGNTEFVAEKIAEVIKADKFAIKTKKEIPHTFMKYVLGGKQTIIKELPEIYDLDFNPDNYEKIVLAAPIWAWAAAPAMRSFMQKYPLKNKEIALLLCHGGGPAKAMNKWVAELEKNGNKIIATKEMKDPLKHFPNRSQTVISGWAEDLI